VFNTVDLHRNGRRTSTPITTPVGAFEDHEGVINAVAVFSDRRRMVTSSADRTLHVWDLKNGVVLKKMNGGASS